MAPQVLQTLEVESQHFFIGGILPDGEGAVGDQGTLVNYLVGWGKGTLTLSAVEEVKLGYGHGIVVRHHNSKLDHIFADIDSIEEKIPKPTT